MKVILLRHVPKVGGPGDVVEVTPGFARNFLLARGLAEPATPSRAKSLAEQTRRAEGRAAKVQRQAEKNAARLKGRVFALRAKATSTGTLYAAVSAQTISRLLAEQGFQINEKYIQADHVKTVGQHQIPIRLGSDYHLHILLEVTPEGEGPR